MRSTADDSTVTRGSGNVFADIGLPDPNLALAKAELALEITRTVKAKGWTQVKAGAAMGIDQPKVSAIMRGRLQGYTVDRLIQLLGRLGQPVALTFPEMGHTRRPKGSGRKGSVRRKGRAVAG